MNELTDLQTVSQRLFSRRWVQHLVFWAAYLSLFSSFHLSRGIAEGEGMLVAFFELIHLSGLLAAVYLNLRILIPRFLSKQKYLFYGLLLLVSVFLISVSVNIIIEHLVPETSTFRAGRRHKGPEFFVFMYMMIQIFFIAVTAFLHYLKESVRLNEIALRVKDLESNKLQTELNSLKAQINPHFLFNTLNNIYSHSLFKSEQTPEMILKLSGLMNYIIYECGDDRVSLSKEIEFIRNYVALEQVRIDEYVQVNLNIAVPENGQRIAPLLFVPLLENAFKYGVNIRDGKPRIDIRLTVDNDNQLELVIENLFDEPDTAEAVTGHGIGLQNIRKRLNLIYPRRHNLTITAANGKFMVNLEIDLND